MVSERFAEIVEELTDQELQWLRFREVWEKLWSDLLECKTADEVSQLLTDEGLYESYSEWWSL